MSNNNGGASGVGDLPPMPHTGPAPGQMDYLTSGNEGAGAGGGAGGGSGHMPPPPPPVQIPPTDASILQSVQTPGGGSVRRAAPEPNKRALYVGGLDLRVGEDLLRQIFETAGHVQNVKIIPDKNNKGFNYGFVEYDDPGAANRAMENLNGRHVHDTEIKVNWAYQNSNIAREDTSNHYHIFVGDLSNDVNDEVLNQAFSTFGTVSEARVMWDMKTGRSRGYGFVAFRSQPDAAKAIASMDGEWLGSRAIRCNWANQKGQPSISVQNQMAAMGLAPQPPYQAHHQFPQNGVNSYDTVVAQTPSWQTTVYVGNLTPYTTQNDVVPLFNNFGHVIESRFQSDRGFAFIKMDTHEHAAIAICQMQGYQVNGRPLKCSWGKDRPPTGQFQNFNLDMYAAQNATGSPVQPSPSFGYPQYGAGPMSPTGAAPSPAPYGVQSPTGFAPPSSSRPGSMYGAEGFAVSGYGHGYSGSQSYGQNAPQSYGGNQAPQSGGGQGGYSYQ